MQFVVKETRPNGRLPYLLSQRNARVFSFLLTTLPCVFLERTITVRKTVADFRDRSVATYTAWFFPGGQEVSTNATKTREASWGGAEEDYNRLMKQQVPATYADYLNGPRFSGTPSHFRMTYSFPYLAFGMGTSAKLGARGGSERISAVAYASKAQPTRCLPLATWRAWMRRRVNPVNPEAEKTGTLRRA